jgi:hypothetical protein
MRGRREQRLSSQTYKCVDRVMSVAPGPRPDHAHLSLVFNSGSPLPRPRSDMLCHFYPHLSLALCVTCSQVHPWAWRAGRLLPGLNSSLPESCGRIFAETQMLRLQADSTCWSRISLPRALFSRLSCEPEVPSLSTRADLDVLNTACDTHVWREMTETRVKLQLKSIRVREGRTVIVTPESHGKRLLKKPGQCPHWHIRTWLWYCG